jgi:SAM-dependent methyltransferase
MGWIGGGLADQWLARYGPREQTVPATAPQATEVLSAADLKAHFDADFIARLPGQHVIDFGCGVGAESVAMALAGAAQVTGLDIQEPRLALARRRAQVLGVAERCTFATHSNSRADLIVSKDAFEHFGDPGAILHLMAGLLKPQGEVYATFGPTWLHPFGGHLFSVFPWSHLLFTEAAQLRWRSRFKDDGATRFSEVEGGLNQLTIAQFERLVAASPLRVVALELVPIRGLKLLTARPWREFGTALVRARLRLK